MKLTKITEANTSVWMFSYKFAAFFQELLFFHKNTSGGLLLFMGNTKIVVRGRSIQNKYFKLPTT